jgi:heme/copper-type cytochrome/quinol oxidase subunit 2
VLLQLSSADVIHSFWVPAFRFKLDVFPHHVNSFVLTAPHPGTWAGHCAEFCGERHAFMLFTLKAVPPAQFRGWVSGPGASAGPSA